LHSDDPLTIGLLGCGVVGGGVAGRILDGLTLERRRTALGSTLVRDLTKPRFPDGVRPYLTLDPNDVLDDPRANAIVECLGGVEPAATYVETALRRGLAVITSNKALIAQRGAYLEGLAVEYGGELKYEAAVGGATPIIRVLQHIAATDEILEVGGVVNGTTNYVLSAMEDGASFEDAVAAAKHAGFAEADPSTDVDGIDAAHKLTILAAAAFGIWPKWESIARRGIREIAKEDIAFARSRNCRVKLTAWARRNGPKSVSAAVGPTFVPRDHPFAGPNGAENVVLVIARHAGPIIVGGLGAGREATASAIVADLLDVTRTIATPPIKKETSNV
jgi:homoserine dehydrogenase